MMIYMGDGGGLYTLVDGKVEITKIIMGGALLLLRE